MTKNKLFLSFLMLAFVGSYAHALGSEELIVRTLNSKAVSAYQVPSESHLMNVYYVGSASQAVLTISGDTLTTAAPIGTADLSIDLSAAAYDTMGELCDSIEAEDDYECKLTGGKRDDDSSLLIDVAGSASVGVVSATGGYDVKHDTGGVSGSTTWINRLGITPESGRRVVLKYCVAENDGVGSFKVYGKLNKYASATDGVTRDDTTLVMSKVTADDTAVTVGNIYSGNWMEFAKDEHVVISVGNGSTTQADTTSHVNCFWDEK